MGKCCGSGIAGQYTGKKSSGTLNRRQISDRLIKNISVSFLYMLGTESQKDNFKCSVFVRFNLP